MDTRVCHPCKQFQDGSVHDFYTAMSVYIAQQVFENESSIQYGPVSAQDRHDQELSLSQVKRATAEATRIYESVVVPALKEAAAQMKTTGDPDLGAIGECLLSGDYSPLSI